MKKFFDRFGLLFIITLPLIIADQITKIIVRGTINIGSSTTPIAWLPFLRFLHVQNTGVAFGLLQGVGWIFAILAFVISIAIIIYFPKVEKRDGFIRFALAMQLAGAVGNLIDRIALGTVTDFISVGNFAIFNIADASISIGTVLLVIGFLIQEIRDRKTKKNEGISEIKNSTNKNGN